MNYIYDTAILSISPPQRGLEITELPTTPPIATPDGCELILSKVFLQWLHVDNTMTTLYTSSLRPRESDIIVKNIGGQETPFILLPYGVAPPPVDMPADPLLTVVSLSVRRAPVPGPASLPAHALQPEWAPSAFQMFPLQSSHTGGVPPPSYAYAPPPYPPPPAHALAVVPAPAPAGAHAPAPAPALTSTAANIAKNRSSARPDLPYRPPPSVFDAFECLVQWHMHLTDHGKRYSDQYSRPCITEYDVMKVRARRTVEAVSSFRWAFAAAGMGLVLAVVF